MLKVVLVVAAIAFVVWVLVKLMLRRLDGAAVAHAPGRSGPTTTPTSCAGSTAPEAQPKPEDD